MIQLPKSLAEALDDYPRELEESRAIATRKLLFHADLNIDRVAPEQAQAVLDITADLDPDAAFMVTSDHYYQETLEHLRGIAQELDGQAVGM